MKTKKNNLASVGERGLLSHLLPRLSRLSPHRFIVPPGDDAAVIRSTPPAALSIDGLTEGTHFKSAWSGRCMSLTGASLGRSLGTKLLGSALSDLAAMGRTQNPWAMIYLGAPPSTPVSFLMDFYDGLKETAQRHQCALAGGDTVKANELSLVAAVGGDLNSRPLTRNGAVIGDAICIAGTVGDASVGLNILEGTMKKVSPKASAYFVRRFFKPEPLFSEGALLSQEPGVHSCLDLSDSLLETVDLLLKASAVGGDVEIDQIPVSPMFDSLFERDQTLLGGGEDYSLLFTASEKAVARLKNKVRFSVIGRVHPRSHGLRFLQKNRPVHPKKFFQHFKRG